MAAMGSRAADGASGKLPLALLVWETATHISDGVCAARMAVLCERHIGMHFMRCKAGVCFARNRCDSNRRRSVDGQCCSGVFGKVELGASSVL